MNNKQTSRTTGGSEPTTLVDQAEFRNVVGHFASGVTVITTIADGQAYGTTASAVSSLSMEPPMMLVCLNRTSSTHDALRTAGVFGINILADSQTELARHFGRKGGDKFADVPHTISPHGVPLLDGALATIVCTIEETVTGGTHTVFLGLAGDAQARDGEPLAYYRGTFDRLGNSREHAAYEETREWVLRRRTPLGQNLDPAAIAASLGSDDRLVHNALIKLTAEGLVRREDANTLTPEPITAAFIDDLYNAREAILVGVIETYLERVTPEDCAQLDNIATAIAQTTSHSEETLDDFLDLNVAFHARLVALAGSHQLTEAFLRLNVGTVWRETFNAEEWSRQRDNDRLSGLMQAIRLRDPQAAKVALRAHTRVTADIAKSVVTRHGGAA